MRTIKGCLAAAAAILLAGCGQPAPAPGSGTNAPADKPTSGTASAAPAAGALSIAVIPKGTGHPFWKTVHAGAAKAAAEEKIEITWLGPSNEADRQSQIDMVNSFIAKGVAAIVLAPLDDTALVQAVETAAQRNIPVVIIDSGLQSDAQKSFVATNNREGGRAAADLLAAAMEDKGKAIMMRYNAGSASTQEREEGFLEQMKEKHTAIELVSTDQYAGVTQETAGETAQGLLNKYGATIQGIFCPNESSAAGMLASLENSGHAGKIKFVGFDASEVLVGGMRAKHIDGLVAQDPFGMGYLGVKTAVKAAKGEPVEKRIDTSLVKITPANLDTPEIQKLIAPELAGM